MKRLYKSRKNKVIDGVCGGIAEYFNVDPVLVRVLFVLFFFLGGSAIIAYIVGMIIMPRAPLQPEQHSNADQSPDPSPQDSTPSTTPPTSTSSSAASAGSLVIGILLLIFGALALANNLDFPFFSDLFRWVRHNFWNFAIPGIFVALGLVLIIKGSEK